VGWGCGLGLLGGILQDVLSQWQFISVRRQVEKGRYYHECNRLTDADSEESFDAASVEGTPDNPKVPQSRLRVGKITWNAGFSHSPCMEIMIGKAGV
jgi:hypothetical protein